MIKRLVTKYCVKEHLSTYDPYDIWKTRVGSFSKNLYNVNKYIGLPLAAILTLVDLYLNNKNRVFYNAQEYPIVRSLATLVLINIYKKSRDSFYLEYAGKHVEWLLQNSSHGYAGYCWGIKFKYPVDKGLVYDDNTPFATITPYALEALHKYNQILQNEKYTDAIKSIYAFLDKDIQVMYEDEHSLATSYGPCADRIVINSLSYTMYSYSLLSKYYLTGDAAVNAHRSAVKIYNYIVERQRPDGSWLYSVDENSFIDCFHSCFVVKNIIKAGQNIELENSNKVVENGYAYIKKSFWDNEKMLFKRFSLENKVNLIKYDLYDNAEMLGLAILREDKALVDTLSVSINDNFIKGDDVYSQIDIFNMKKNKNTLRWAVMPFLYSLSKMNND